MNPIAPLRPVALVVWRLIASTGRPLCFEQIQNDPSVIQACRLAHDSCQRVLDRLCSLGHLVNDGAALHVRAYWWGPTCLLPVGEEDHPRFCTIADSARALPRTQWEPLAHPLDAVPLPLRPGSMDFVAHPSRRGNRLVFRDGNVSTLPAPSLSPSALPQPA